MRYDIERIRGQFPGLKRTQDSKPAVFFDNPAGTQIAQQALDRMLEAMVGSNANLGGHFATSLEARAAVDAAHRAAAAFVNAADPGEVFFGQNMTTLTFALSRSIGRELKPGDEILLTRMDHDGNVTPWVMLAEERGLTIRWLDFSPETFEYDLGELDRVLGKRTRVAAINYASNVTGTINDVKAIARAARAVGALVYVDAVQYAPHGVIDVRDLGCDFLLCSAYKFYGPHYGLCWGRREVLERLTAYKVRAARNELPAKFVTGSTNREALAGIRGAIEYFEWVGAEFGGAPVAGGDSAPRQRVVAGVEAMRRHDAVLAKRLVDGLRTFKGVRVQGITDTQAMDRRVPTVSFVMDGHEPGRIAQFMAGEGVYVWHGHNYGVEPVKRLGLLESGGVVRVGPTHYNTVEEIDRFLEALERYRARNEA